MNSSDVKCYWSDGLVKNALFDNILHTINRRTDNIMAKRKSKKGQTTICKTCT